MIDSTTKAELVKANPERAAPLHPSTDQANKPLPLSDLPAFSLIDSEQKQELDQHIGVFFEKQLQQNHTSTNRQAEHKPLVIELIDGEESSSSSDELVGSEVYQPEPSVTQSSSVPHKPLELGPPTDTLDSTLTLGQHKPLPLDQPTPSVPHKPLPLSPKLWAQTIPSIAQENTNFLHKEPAEQLDTLVKNLVSALKNTQQTYQIASQPLLSTGIAPSSQIPNTEWRDSLWF